MKKEYKHFWFSIPLFLISGSIAYYFLIYIPQKDADIYQKQIYELNLKNRTHCQEMGEKYSVQQKKENPSETVKYQVIFDEGTDECLYDGELSLSYGMMDGKRISKSIVNLFTHRVLAEYSYTIDWLEKDKYIISGNETEYNEAKDHYFEKNYPPLNE